MAEYIKSVIVEDESIHSNRLKKLLATTDKKIQVLAVCDTTEDAAAKIALHQPDVVFLDIQLHEDSHGGFNLLKKFKQPTFDVIFTTAHIDKNIGEIRRCGLAHLVKPYIQEELNDILQKIWNKHAGNVGLRQLDTLLHNLVTEHIDEQQVWINRVEDGFTTIKVKNLIYCTSDSQYTHVHYREEENREKLKELRTSVGLNIWEKDLAVLKFCRIHEKYLINTKCIKSYDQKNRRLYLTNIKQWFDVSESGHERLLAFIKSSIFPITKK